MDNNSDSIIICSKCRLHNIRFCYDKMYTQCMARRWKRRLHDIEF